MSKFNISALGCCYERLHEIYLINENKLCPKF